MFWLIVAGYLVSSAAALYFFLCLEKRFKAEGVSDFYASTVRSALCAAFWFVTTPFYLAYLSAVWKFNERDGDAVVFVFENGYKCRHRVYRLYALLSDIRQNGNVIRIEKAE